MKENNEYISYLLSYIGEAGNRVAFSKEETQAKIRLIAEMKKLGLDVYTDEAGNIYGFLYANNEGSNNETIKVIGIGSHIDSVPDGGNFDGLVGIISGLSVIKTINENDVKIKENIAIIALECEESSVFGKSCLGSKFISNKISAEQLRAIPIVSEHFNDGSGLTYGDKLDECNKYLQLPILNKKIEFLYFLEPHIEQGPMLVDSNKKIGIVSSIAAPSRVKFTLIGKGGHDGTIPMTSRRDALVGFNELYNIYRGLRHDMNINDRLRTNIGVVDIEGSSINRIPGKLSTTVSARGLDDKLMTEFMDELISRVESNLPDIDIKVITEKLEQGIPVHLNPDLVNKVRKSAEEYSSLEMWSGAGHDTVYMNEVCRYGAIVFFIPNTGISHEPSECAEVEDINLAVCLLGKLLEEIK